MSPLRIAAWVLLALAAFPSTALADQYCGEDQTACMGLNNESFACIDWPTNPVCCWGWGYAAGHKCCKEEDVDGGDPNYVGCPHWKVCAWDCEADGGARIRKRCMEDYDLACNGGFGPPPSPGPADNSPPPPCCGCGPGPGGPGDNKPKSSGRVQGDPFLVDNATSYEYRVDVSVPGALGPLEFSRTFGSRGDEWTDDAPLTGVPRPFGTTPNVTDGGYDSMEWWHNHLALVVITQADRPMWSVRDVGGRILRYATCDILPCYAQPAVGNSGLRDRLQRLADGTFVLWHQDGSRNVFAAAYEVGSAGVKRYFLTESYSATGALKATVTYQAPSVSGGCPAGGSGSGAGVPYVYEVTSPESKLRLTYKKLTRADSVDECVVDKVSLIAADAGILVVGTYTYVTSGSERPGRIASATLPSRTEEYTYSSSAYTQSIGGTLMATHAYTASQVTSSTATDEVIAVSTPTTLTDGGICGQPVKLTTLTYSSDTKGNGASGSPGLTRYFKTVTGFGHDSQPRVTSILDECTGFANACSPGTQVWEWACALGDSPAHFLGHQNKRGYWTTSKWGTVVVGDAMGVLEKRSDTWGASSSTGTGLTTSVYSYEYGADGQQRLKTTTRPGIYSASGNTWTMATNHYDSAGYLVKVTEKGYTLGDYPYNSELQRVRATFYSKSRTCGDTAGPDTLGRTLEVRGPCWAANESSTACNDTYGAHPVTVYEYYSGSEGGNRANRLKKVLRYVAGSSDCASGTPLVTEYKAYDVFGNATTVTDENNVDTTFEFDGTRMTRKYVAATGAETRFAYEGDKLKQVRYPEGNGEFLCYRKASGGGPAWPCTTAGGTTFSTKLQWKAKMSCTSGSTPECDGTTTSWSEMVLYEYASDGSVAKEKYRVCESTSGCTGLTGGVQRRVLKHQADAHGRPTWNAVGDAPDAGQYDNVAFFDRADNLAGVGRASNKPPPFCDGASGSSGDSADTPTSKLCSWLKYDAANRLEVLTEFETPSSNGTKTFFKHDAHNNVSGVKMGCASSDTTYSGCTQTPATFRYDDFGTLMEAKFPWTPGSGNAGMHRWVYNPRGQPIIHQGPTNSASIGRDEFVYDGLGRITQHNIYDANNASNLRTLTYDAVTVGSGCTSLTNTKGRLALREDAFGKTYFSYDAEGRVVSVQRIRGTGSACDTSNRSISPNTAYTYNLNGAVTAMTYPTGRSVEYVYGTGAFLDRVASVKAYVYGLGLTTVIQGVLWEPYGGLRGYQNPSLVGAASSSVYYHLGDNAETPATCNTTPNEGASDFTGRLRALRVTSGLVSSANSTGDIYRRVYQWKGEVPVTISSCLLSDTRERVQAYGYDGMGRLTSEVFATDAGITYGQAFTFNAVGSRASITGTTTDGGYYTALAYTGTTDTLYSSYQSNVSQTGPKVAATYVADADGRIIKRNAGVGETTHSQWEATYLKNWGTTLSTLGFGDAWYNYYFDADNRRFAKVNPYGDRDDFFYDEGHQLLVDVGNQVLNSPADAGRPVDEYVWVGGRPLAYFHSMVSQSWAHNDADGTGDCRRNGEAQACGGYSLVTDAIGYPVLQLDMYGKVTAAVEHDGFGFPNRRVIQAVDAYSYPASYTTPLPIGGFSMTGADAGLVLEARVKFVDVPPYSGTPDVLHVYNSSANSVWNYTRASSTQLEPVWTSWLAMSASPDMNVKVVPGNSAGGTGQVAVEAFEYRRYEAAALGPALTPLRFPGQYHDTESDLLENWNRYYEPYTGRYLQPEPLWSEPGYVKLVALQGTTTPAYSYAANNPMKFVDADGNNPAVGALGGAIGGLPGIVIGGAIGTAVLIYCAITGNCPPIPVPWEQDKCETTKKECANKCPKPPPPETDYDHLHAGCVPHWHYYEYHQNPVTCQCFGPYRKFGGCGVAPSGAN